MSTFFTSDTHFGSERTLKFSRRPFKTTTEMDETFIKNWNELIKSEDIIYHLGDFGDFSKLKQLNGKVILILGNYEKDDMKDNFNNNFDQYQKYLLSLGFVKVYEDGCFVDLDETNKSALA